MAGLSLVRQVSGWLVVAALSVPTVLRAQAVEASLASSAASADLRCAVPSPQRSTPHRMTPATTIVASDSIHLTVACAEEPAASRAPGPSLGMPTPSASPARSGATPTPTSPDADAITRLAALFPQAVLLVLAIAAVMLACAALVVLRDAFAPAQSVGNADSFVFQRHWGGFGGGSTGWVISERLVRVIVGLVLGGLAAALAMQLVPGKDERAGSVGARQPDAAASASVAKE